MSVAFLDEMADASRERVRAAKHTRSEAALEVHARQFDDDPVLALRPYDRFRVAAAVDAALDDRDRDVACRLGGDPGTHVGDLELEVRAALQVEPLVDVDLLVEAQKWDRECRRAANRASQRLVGCQPVDVGEPVDEDGNHGNDGNQCQESTIDAHARESIGEGR